MYMVFKYGKFTLKAINKEFAWESDVLFCKKVYCF